MNELVFRICFHIFSGTGKTSVAIIYSNILCELGLLSKGEVVIKNPSDFIGSALGESEQRTNSILDESRGCVLVIDEAYGLHSTSKGTDPYKVFNNLTNIFVHVKHISKSFSGL